MLELIKSLIYYNSLESELLADSGDSPLVRKHSFFKNIEVDSFRFRLRMFRLQHHKSSKLPNLPTVVFVHGLGGQLNQFEPLIDYFTHFASVIAVDLPGHGRSDPAPKWEAYSPQVLVDLLEEIVTSELPENCSGEVVLVGHSMGSVLSSRLAIKLNHKNSDAVNGLKAKGIVMLCPPGVVDPKLADAQKSLPYMPASLFNVFRTLDRSGGIESKSVKRMVAADAPTNIRKKQLQWNLQVNTKPWMATAAQFTVLSETELEQLSQIPTFLIGAADDQVTPVESNLSYLSKTISKFAEGNGVAHCQTVISHAGHALMIEKPEYTCGIIGDFVSANISSKLSLAWQLAYLAGQSDKWSLKNEEKWRNVQPVGDVIKGSRLRGMKTLRQDDETHSPSLLEKNHPEIVAIIDISREEPPYDPNSFKKIEYHKFPTVSKIPPTKKEVEEFIQLVNGILQKYPDPNTNVAVHCHYGFNRTGFFLCSYLILELHISIKEAVAKFKQSRSPGIKHPHFIDELYVRYS